MGDPVHYVRVGDFLTRGDALAFIKRAGALGLNEAWIVREEVAEPENHPHWVQVNGQLINLNAEASLYFIPRSSESFLAFRGRTYRGILVLRGSRKGLILINILNVEDYLKGVVPGELPPSFFNELEAQKAQAVAARTYALKNLGQFNELGFDLYATPVSQVYLGLSAEHPLSTRAVEETRGEAAVYDGKLINALYMSTCGGATEDVDVMFEGGPMPYLKSTVCVQDGEDEWSLKSPAVFPPVIVENKSVAAPLAMLTALGVLELQTDPAWWKAPATMAEAWGWMAKAAGLLGKKPGRGSRRERFSQLSRPGLGAGLGLRLERPHRQPGRPRGGGPRAAGFSRLGAAREGRAGLLSWPPAWPPPAQIGADHGRTISRAEAALCHPQGPRDLQGLLPAGLGARYPGDFDDSACRGGRQDD